MSKTKEKEKDKEEGVKSKLDFDKILQSGRELYDKKQEIISISPSIDFGLSGGLTKGIWVILSGAPKCGKTSLSLRMAACCQKAGMKEVFYTDAEGRFKSMNIHGTVGLNVDDFFLIRSTSDKIYTAEELIEINIHLIKTKPNSVFILDSLSALCPESEMNSEVAANTRLSTPKLLATFLRRVGTILPPQDSIFIAIQHVIANTSGYGAASMEDGGNKIKYQADVKMRCKKVEPWDEEKKQIGQLLTWDIESSALGQPHIPTQSYLRYGSGIDAAQELVNMAGDFGLFVVRGAWYSFFYEDKKTKETTMSTLLEDDEFKAYYKSIDVDPQEVKLCGKAKAREYILEHPKLYDIMNQRLK